MFSKSYGIVFLALHVRAVSGVQEQCVESVAMFDDKQSVKSQYAAPETKHVISIVACSVVSVDKHL